MFRCSCGGQVDAAVTKKLKVTSVYQYRTTLKYAVKRDGKQIFQARTANSLKAELVMLFSISPSRWVESGTRTKRSAKRLLSGPWCAVIDLLFPFPLNACLKEIGRKYLLDGKADSFVKDVVAGFSILFSSSSFCRTSCASLPNRTSSISKATMESQLELEDGSPLSY